MVDAGYVAGAPSRAAVTSFREEGITGTFATPNARQF